MVGQFGALTPQYVRFEPHHPWVIGPQDQWTYLVGAVLEPSPCPIVPSSSNMSELNFDYHLSHPDLPPEHRTVRITLPAKGLSEDQLKEFPAFQRWITTLAGSLALQYSEKDHKFHSHPYAIERIEAQSTVWFAENRLGFVKIQLTIKNDEGQIPGAVFLRGGSVAMLASVA